MQPPRPRGLRYRWAARMVSVSSVGHACLGAEWFVAFDFQKRGGGGGSFLVFGGSVFSSYFLFQGGRCSTFADRLLKTRLQRT